MEPDHALCGNVGLSNAAGAERSCDSTCRHAGFRLSQANGVDPGELRTVPQRVHSATPPRPRRTWPLAFGGYQPSQTLQTLEHPCDRSSAQQFECGLAKKSSLRRMESRGRGPPSNKEKFQTRVTEHHLNSQQQLGLNPTRTQEEHRRGK